MSRHVILVADILRPNRWDDQWLTVGVPNDWPHALPQRSHEGLLWLVLVGKARSTERMSCGSG